MSDKYTIEVKQEVKEKINCLMNQTGLDVNSLIDKLIKKNDTYEEEINKVIQEFRMCKENELNAFNIADSVSDGIYLIDKNGIVITINKVYEEMIGVKENEILGKHIQDVWDEKGFNSNVALAIVKQDKKIDATDMIDKSIKENLTMKIPQPVSLMALEEKRKISVITTNERNNNTVLMIGTPLLNEQGEALQVMTVIRDLTELVGLKKRVEEVENEKRKYLSELKYLKKNQAHSGLLGESSAINKLKKLIDSVAKTDVTVLITGETGVGKEVVAREIFKNSKREGRPYIKINCAAIPETLLEAELFGYEKGAFTGAQQKEKLGFFEIANKGTLLLDEIGEMPYKLQSKLLRVLQEKEIKRIGGTKNIKIDVRIIAATNQNLQQQIRKGEFREDLYYRLNVVSLEIPPLRERKEDIPILVYVFLKRFNEKYNKNKSFQRDAIEILDSYSWPGNVRQLENTIERLIVIGDEDTITRDDVLNVLGRENFVLYDVDNSKVTLKEAVELLEKNIIEKALKKHGSTHKAAKVLGITQSTVVRKAKALGIKEW